MNDETNNDLSKYRNIVAQIRVDHAAYADILDELREAYDAIGQTPSPVCLLITGESRTGKSSVVTDMLESYLPQRVDDRTIRTVVYAVAPAKATVKSLLESLLRGLGDPHWSRGSESNLTQRLYTLLDAVKCRLIILDEFQHLCDKGQQRKLDFVSDWLKVLLETGKYGLVAVGLPAAASVVHNHTQLIGRFDDELRMPLFDWQDDASAKQFRGILHQFQEEMHPFELPPLGSKEMGVRMYLASAGRIGQVARILDRAVRDAIRHGRVEIRMDDLAVAYKRAIWSARLFPLEAGPFGATLEQLGMKGIQDTILANAALEKVADESGAVAVYGKETATAKSVVPIGQGRQKKSANPKEPKSRVRAEVKRQLARAL